MSESKTVTVDLGPVSGGIVDGVDKILSALNDVEKVSLEISALISDEFVFAAENVMILASGVNQLSESMKSVTQWDLGSVSEELAEISQLLDEIAEEVGKTDWVGISQLALELYAAKGQIGGGFGKGLFGGYEGKYLSKKEKTSSDSSGIITGSLGMVDSDWVELLEQITEGFKASAAATWLQNAATTAWQAISTAATAVTTAFGAAVTFLTSPIGLVVVAVAALIAVIVALVANWDTVKAGLIAGWEAVKVAFSTAMEWIGGVVQSGIGIIQGVFQGVDDFLQNVFATNWSEKFGFFGGVLDGFFANVENIWNAVKTVFQGVVDFVSSVFAGDWKGAWEGIVTVFTGIWDGIVAYLKVPINAAIGVVNGFLSHVETIVNAVIGLLNGICVEVPDWEIFGDLAGNTYGFNIAPVSLPQIPHLAKGAVLPANRPFLAMVGDQRHGTNVEAPLATIQEAVALVMNDQLSAMMAGFEAVVREQQAIRAVVEGIEVGDEVIGRAAVRYGERMAVVRGVV